MIHIYVRIDIVFQANPGKQATCQVPDIELSKDISFFSLPATHRSHRLLHSLSLVLSGGCALGRWQNLLLDMQTASINEISDASTSSSQA